MTRRQRDLAGDVGPLGWALDGTTRGGHLRLLHLRSGQVYFTAATPSDWRARRRMLADLRRIGRTDNRGQTAATS